MWTVLRILSLAALILVLTVPAGSGATKVNVTLNPENGSGESGTATLRDVGSGETKVEVKITGEPGHPQPMHIHKGTCANLDPKPAYGLPSLMNGKSEARPRERFPAAPTRGHLAPHGGVCRGKHSAVVAVMGRESYGAAGEGAP